MSNNNETHNELTLTSIDKIIEKVGRRLSWLYLFIVFISFYEIIARYIFNSPTEWVHELSIALAGFLMVYAGLFAYGRDKHIRVPILLNNVPDKWRNILEIFSKLVTLAFLLLLAYSAYFVAQTAIFSPSGELMLERSGSAWNPPIPGLLKASLFVLTMIFIIQVFFKLLSHFSINKEK
ncbi:MULTISPECIES: TRAP transporter small permease subunit [unclassified Avibacterium]|uniref:TRAP transporter small permease subunit n=1 Tax=unclassified Avibacterium TaxID=2685287 RepID=UPI00202634F3|nr:MULTISPECIES: TRAP transporter small permease subunit [unclassified Avibacterium]MCW9699801.1 TRAP transporter small permease subunit [Avibacterium sp. 20-129]URL06419.1 TRAP transporter small permease subunit [Avibacterium sp. 21-595]